MSVTKIILAITIIIFLSVLTQAQAAWYDWFWGVKKETPIETKNQNESKPDTTQVIPVKLESTPSTQEPSTEIESLKIEVATLKVSLDNLYKAHTRLVEDHNKLLKYTTEIVAVIRGEIKNTPQAPVGSNLDSLKIAAIEEDLRNYKNDIDELEKTVDDVCAQIFSSPFGGFSTNKCPSSQFLIIKETLEYRIKKLEGGY